MVTSPHAGTLAVAVAATLRGTVAAHKAKVAAAVIRLHARTVHTALGTHRATQPRHAAGRDRRGSAQGLRVGQRRAHPEPACSPLFLGSPIKLADPAPPPPSPHQHPLLNQSHYLHALNSVFFHPALVHTSSVTAVQAHSPQARPGPGLAAASLVHGVARLAAALITVGPVVAVLCLVAVMVPVCTLVLRGAGQEGPGGPRTPTRQPWHGDAGLQWGLCHPPRCPGPRSYFLSTTSAPAPLTPPPKPLSPSRGPLSPPSRQRPPPSWPPQAHQPQWGRRRHKAHWVAWAQPREQLSGPRSSLPQPPAIHRRGR